VLVDGRVQGVGFRQACAEMARRRRLGGWVRNRRDGRVEAVFEGPAADVAQLVDWCRTGPIMASVTDVRVTEDAPTGTTTFRVASTG
jgi:acylphosphatase